MTDRWFALSLAVAATAGLAGWHTHPGWLTLFLAVLNGLAIWRWHSRGDWFAFALGATAGNATELAADAAGLWIHAERQVLGIAPPYILLCYPLLWMAAPRLLAHPRFSFPRTTGPDAAYALTVWALHCAACCLGSGTGAWLMGTSVLAAAALAIRFHTAADLWFAACGGALGMLWEIPCTWSGAWRFPAPDLAGLIPAWLPVAYAVFFLSLNRVRLFGYPDSSARLENRTPTDRLPYRGNHRDALPARRAG
jgi:hypothetical protein